MFRTAEKGSVKILPGLFRERMDANISYLKELDTQCLLQNYYLEAGVIMPGLQVVPEPEKAKLHWGWESPTCQLRGHFLGHWLSAAAKLIAFEHDAELKVKLDKIVSELARCQELNGGEWVAPIPEKYFARLETDLYIWSPQYTMHKLIMGLIHAYAYAGNTQALEILNHLSDWYIKWTEKVQKTAPHAVYSGEEAGMPEVWAELFELTKNEKYLTLARRYADAGIFRRLKAGEDGLSSRHANASIPFSHGAAKLYEATGDKEWLDVLRLFWKCAVTDRGMFCTSGQNAGEFWVPPFLQGHFLGENDQEFCTVYNMTRTALYLYKHTGEAEYADYIERALYNGFLAQQNPETGMPTYFLPLLAGSHKKWGSKTHDFWCCHGTMVQAQTLYPELIWFEREGSITVGQYIPSEYSTRINGADVTVSQTTGMKYYNDQAFFDEKDEGQMSRWLLRFSVTCSCPTAFSLRFRVPSWIKGAPEVTLNGEKLAPQITDGYFELSRQWENGTLEIFFPSALRAEFLPDMPELAAFMDGPIVLAGLTDGDGGLAGDFSEPSAFISPQYEHSYGTFPWRQSCFRTRGQSKNIMFRPLYEIRDEAYTVYFTKK